MKQNDIILIFLLFIFAFALRFYDISYPAFRWGDEQGHVPAAVNYWSKGYFEPDNWEHPPLRHILLYGFLKIFGDNPYGWRMRNVLFGAAASVLTAFFAYAISGSRKTAALAGLLLAADPLHIVLSRYTFEEIYGGAFFLAAIVLFLMQKGSAWRLILSAFFMGCALAIKWYYVPVWLLIYALALAENRNYRDIRNALFVTSAWVLIPLTVYISSYYLWFGRGYLFSEFMEFTVNAYYALQSYTPEDYSSNLFFLSHLNASEWFIKPIMAGQGTCFSPERCEFIIYGNNLPVWILTLPAMAATGIIALRRKSIRFGIPVLFFLSTYILFLFVKRPTFIYSSIPLLPFAFTAIALCISELSDRLNGKIFYVVLAVLLCWSLYLYPLVTAKKVPTAYYRFILDKADLKIY